MDGTPSSRWQVEVVRTLRALGGRATVGDLIVTTGLPRLEVERSIEALMAAERVQVTVSESAVLSYRLHERRATTRTPARRWMSAAAVGSGSSAVTTRPRGVGFERKTLRLIRAREGVLSLAELVEHTGLPLREATQEMHRLVERYGGEAHPSWDGHIVYAFPELMVSAHGDFDVREPRPAWVRARDPMQRPGKGPHRTTLDLALNGVGLAVAAAAPWLALAHPAIDGVMVLGVVITASAGAGLVFGRNLMRALGRTRRYRFRDTGTLRRYALGYVFETALKGKGVVSLDRTAKYLQARAGRRKVSKAGVQRALRQLAEEFNAPITEVSGDLFFGFRNVKRQFLASHVQRTRLRLARTVAGETVFDSADSGPVGAARDLEAFDRALEAGGKPETAPATPGSPPPP